MAQKYPNCYFQNFLEMISVNYPAPRGKVDLSEENVNDFILLYIHIEGEEEFKKLKEEVLQIVKHKDLALFRLSAFKDVEDISFVAETVLKKK
jgi:hypothetical protein